MGKNENIEIKRILDILKSKRILIISVLIIFTILGYIYSSYCVVPKYKSSTTLLIIPNSADENRTITNSDLTLNSGLISTYSNIAKNSKVLKQVINNLGLNITESQLLNNIKISVIKNTHIMEITVTDSDPQKAFNITKELASVFLDEIKQIYNLENIGIVDEAQLPKNPYNNNYIKDIAIFFIIGMLISAFYIMMIYIFDNTIKKEDDIENYIKVKALGSIPIDNNKNEIIERNNAKSYIVECINTIRTNILYMNSTKNAKTILVTSCTPREGKSWTSANIATAFAETNKKVLLIDADMRKGRANKIFDIDNTEGLSNYLYFITGNTKKDIELGKKYIKETQIPNLHILTNGTTPPNPSELLDSEEMKELMTILKNVYDIIIIDAPPCKLVTDSIILSTIVDSTILVADSESTKIADLSEVKKSIDIVGGKVIGVILNKVKISAKTYGKSYYYGHDEAENDKSEIQEKTIISVNEVINKAIEKLKERDFDIYFEENEIEEEKINNLTENNNDYNINEIIKNQNQYLQKMANSISDIKVQINNNLIKNKTENENITKKIEELQRKNNIELKEEIRNTDNKIEVNKISEQLEELKLNYKEILPEIKNNDEKDKLIQELAQANLKEEQVREILKEEIANIDYARKVNEISEQLEKLKLNYEEILPEIKNNDEKDKLIQELAQTNLNKEQIREILREEVLNSKYSEKINDIFNEINNVKTDYDQIIEKIKEIKDKENIIEETSRNNITSEQIKEILKEEISTIDYAEQINYMNEMITNLKDSYLELSNIVRTNNLEISQIDNNIDNIIDLKLLKKQKQKEQKEQKQKKKVFSIEDEISYDELEKTAVCVIPLKTKNDESYKIESIM